MRSIFFESFPIIIKTAMVRFRLRLLLMQVVLEQEALTQTLSLVTLGPNAKEMRILKPVPSAATQPTHHTKPLGCRFMSHRGKDMRA